MSQFSSGKHEKLTADTHPYRVVFGPWAGARMQAPQAGMTDHDPRPDFDRPLINPANPILQSIRDQGWSNLNGAGKWNELAGWLRWLGDESHKIFYWQSLESIAHARRVLTRLANLTKDES